MVFNVPGKQKSCGFWELPSCLPGENKPRLGRGLVTVDREISDGIQGGDIGALPFLFLALEIGLEHLEKYALGAYFGE